MGSQPVEQPVRRVAGLATAYGAEAYEAHGYSYFPDYGVDEGSDELGEGLRRKADVVGQGAGEALRSISIDT